MKTELEKARELVKKLEEEEKQDKKHKLSVKFDQISDEQKIKFFDNIYRHGIDEPILEETINDVEQEIKNLMKLIFEVFIINLKN